MEKEKPMTQEELKLTKEKFRSKRLIVLEGRPNSGKTTTLFEVARQLAFKHLPKDQQCCIEAAFNTFVNPDYSKSDLRIVLPIDNGKYVYLSSHGDDLINIHNNMKFFTNSIDHFLRVFLAHKSGLSRIKWKDLNMYPPVVCVTACSYPQNGENEQKAEQMKEELKFIDDKGIWIKKQWGEKQPDGFSDEDRIIIEKILKEIEGTSHKTVITTK